jgi:hypothetical protein
MDFGLYFGLVAAVFLCFALRAIPRIGRPLIGHDTWALLLVIDEIKKGHGYNGVCRYFLIKGDHDYPPLFFYFLSLLPMSWLKKYNWLINPIFDSVNSGLVFGVTYLLGGSPLMAFAAAGIYSVTPAVLEESLNFNTRIFGLIMFNISLASLVLHYYSGASMFLVISTTAGVIVLLSHMFATQVLYPLLISFTVLIQSYVPLLVLLGAIIAAIVFSGGFYFRILSGHIGTIRFWLKHYKEYGLDYLSKQVVAQKATVRKNPKDSNDHSMLVRVWRRTKRLNPFYWLLKISPFNPFALMPFIMLPWIHLEMAWQTIVLGWSILTTVFFYLATYLRFLGHYPGRRQFLHYGAFPTAYVCSTLVLESSSPFALVVLSVTFLLSIIQNVRTWLRTCLHNRADDQSLLQETFKYLRNSNKDGVICLPASHTYAVPYFSGKKVFYTMCHRNYEKLGLFFPVLSVPLKELIEEYDIHFVLVDTTIVPISQIAPKGFEMIMEENDYALLERIE